MTLRNRVFSSFALLLALVGAVAACGGDDPATSADLEFTDVWSRQPAEGQPNSAVYGTVTNAGSTDVTIVGASAGVTDHVELHETLMEDGVMRMREKTDGFVVPAGGSFVFEPGGPHVMLLGIDPATYPTDAVDITLTFDSGDPVFLSAEVRAIDMSQMGMNHDDMNHDDMNHDDMNHEDS